MKVAIYTIAKNEHHNVKKWCDSNSQADIRLVCDTGSTDETMLLLKQSNVEVVPITVVPWRFDIARNTSLSLLPKDVDVCIYQDLDEQLLPGWYEELYQIWKPNISVINHRYKHNNNPWQWHSKIHNRHGCSWVGAVHETLKWENKQAEIFTNNIFLLETQTKKQDRGKYKDLLFLKIQEGDNNWRTYFFLANETNDPQYLITAYNVCDEGNLVKSYIAKTIGARLQSEKWLLQAITDSPEKECYYEVAKYYFNNSKYFEAIIMCREGMKPNIIKRDGFTYDDRAWGNEFNQILDTCYQKLAPGQEIE